ncbi:MAG TPA: glycosyltransferase [Noviherbaspirillum sp.]
MNEIDRYSRCAPMISFVIKTYNEEAKVAACIESVLNAVRGLPNHIEIIVADSLSTDRTIEIAAAYPVKIVQFLHVEERGCGAGVQMGYQHSCGDLIFILDGDMTLQKEFLPAALRAFARDDRLGGVAGLMREAAVRNAFDEARIASGAASTARDERWLNGGGIYRRDAIISAGGYAANRNLKGWEEAELGMRLRAAGWRLRRLAVPAVVHDGHAADTWSLLARHWSSGRLMANGVLLRVTFGQPWFHEALMLQRRPLCIALAWAVFATALLLSTPSSIGQLLAVAVMACVALVVLVGMRKRSVGAALVSIALLHVHAAATIKGLFWRKTPVRSPIRSAIVSG